jgi:hypothetical protein
MVNRDKFDLLQSIWLDGAMFSHIATFLLTFGFSLGIEMGITWKADPGDSVAMALSLVCGFSAFAGLIFLAFAARNAKKFRALRGDLFANQK